MIFNNNTPNIQTVYKQMLDLTCYTNHDFDEARDRALVQAPYFLWNSRGTQARHL